MKTLRILLFVPFLFSCRKNMELIFVDYYPNGNKRMEVRYINDMLQGPYIMWFEDGSKQLEAVFDKDSILGKCIIWMPDGLKAMEIDYNLLIDSSTNDSSQRRNLLERNMLYGWLKYEAEKLRMKIKKETVEYHRVKCLLLKSMV